MECYKGGYYDMHCHILPGLDDGAKSMKESLKMLELSYEEGVRHICATPHFKVGDSLNGNKIRLLCEKLQEQARVRWPDMNIYPGNELLYSYGITEALERGEALTLNQSRYVLIEFHPGESYQGILRGVQELMSQGYRPIIAHVERLECLHRRWERFAELRQMYVKMQLNSRSLMGGLLDRRAMYGKSLVKRGYIQLLGSDAHGSERRAPRYKEAADRILKTCGIEVHNIITEINPKKILENANFK